MLTVLGFVPLSLGCTHEAARDVDFSPRPTVGLSNAVVLYNATPENDRRTPDAVSNGPESCGRYMENGVLRYQWPPCPTPQPPPSAQPSTSGQPSTSAVAPMVLLLPPTSTKAASASSLANPWHEKFFVEWPCSHKLVVDGEALAVVACTIPEP
jgi:hypothetical protein